MLIYRIEGKELGFGPYRETEHRDISTYISPFSAKERPCWHLDFDTNFWDDCFSGVGSIKS